MRAALAVLLTSALLLSAAPALASPVCPDEPRVACGGRIFPEAENSTAFVQHDMGEYIDGIKTLERDFPRFVKVRNFSGVLGREVTGVRVAHRSDTGRVSRMALEPAAFIDAAL